MILAAGLGERLKPLTLKTPKALIKIRETPLIEIVARKLVSSGFDQIAVNVHHFADEIEAFIRSKNSFGAEIFISRETRRPLGTGGGIFWAKDFLKDGDSFLIHNVDVISDTDIKCLYDYHKKSGNTATLSVKKRSSSRQLLFGKNGFLQGRKTGEEVKTTNFLTEFAFSGIHCASSAIFDVMAPEEAFSIIDFYLSSQFLGKIGFLEDRGKFWFDAGKTQSLTLLQKSDFGRLS